MSLIKKSVLNKIRKDLVKQNKGKDVTNEQWNQVVKEVEDDIREKLKKAGPKIAKAFYFSMYEMAEKGDVIIETDGVDLGQQIRDLRNKKMIQKLKEEKDFNGKKES